MKNTTLISEMQVNYVKNSIVKRYTVNLMMPRKYLIQVISDIGQAKLFIQAYNNLDYLIRTKQLTNFKSIGREVKYQATTTKYLKICVTQQYC